LKLDLTKTDPQYDLKVKMILKSSENTSRTFKIMNDLTNPIFFITLSWCRFLVFNDDIWSLKKQISDFQLKKSLPTPPNWIQALIEEDFFITPVSL
jgi:hypothetical protein